MPFTRRWLQNSNHCFSVQHPQFQIVRVGSTFKRRVQDWDGTVQNMNAAFDLGTSQFNFQTASLTFKRRVSLLNSPVQLWNWLFES
jgi:hypothetical protein